MKIVHIDTEYRWRGGQQQLLFLAAELQKLHHNNFVITQPKSELYFRARETGLNAIDIKMRGEFDIAAILQIRTILKKNNADILHMHSGNAHSLGFLASLNLKNIEKIVSRRVSRPLRRSPWSKLKYSRGTDRFIAVSYAVKKILLNYRISPSKISVVYDGINPDRFANLDQTNPLDKFGISTESFIVGNIASMTWEKGQGFLIEAAAEVIKKRNDVRFIIVGDGKLQSKLHRMVKQLGIENYVQFSGFQKDIISFLRSFDLFVMPSIYEGLGTSILDAMALNIPIIASRTGGIPEIITDGQTGLLVPPANSKALANAIIKVLEEPALRKRLAAKTQKIVEEKFSLSRMVQGTLSAYHQTFEKQRYPTIKNNFIKKSVPCGVTIVRKDWAQQLLRLGIGEPEKMESGLIENKKHLKGRSNYRVLPIENSGESIIVKSMSHGGIFAKLFGDIYLDHKKPTNEASISAYALRKGIPTSELLAVVEKRTFTPFFKYWVFSKEIADVMDFLCYLKNYGKSNNKKCGAIKATARAVRKMHDAGIFHTDLHLKNILIRPSSSDEKFKAFIIDFDKAKYVQNMSIRKRFQNLKRLWRSAEKAKIQGYPISQTDMIRFIREYAGDEFDCYKKYIRAYKFIAVHRWRYRTGFKKNLDC